MSKLKSPFLSFGARGTIGDSMTFQKRGRGHFARQKPIPADPKSPAQLAQRQRYKDAVAAWHALSPEEKEAWRGVCPGLTAYQCFMNSELKYVEPAPPPEEYTEEQTNYDKAASIYGLGWYRRGQKLTIPNRQVTKLGFWLDRRNSPTGDVILAIRKVSDDSLICSKRLCNASEISTEVTYYEVTFDTPVTINEEVRIYTEFSGGNAYNYLSIHYQNSDVKPDECYTAQSSGPWIDDETQDTAYRYKYYLP